MLWLSDWRYNSDWRHNFMLMLTGYFDETGDLPDINRKLNGMAGFVTTTDNWFSIHQDWQEHIKTQQYNGYHDVDIRQSRKEKRRKPLLDILERYWVIPVGFFVSMDAFYRLPLLGRVGFGNPYFNAFCMCVWVAEQGAIANKTTGEIIRNLRIATIFDRKKERFQQQALLYYRWLAALSPRLDRILEQPAFKSSQDCIALNMADMLAAILREEYERQLYSPNDQLRDSYIRIVKIAEKAFVERSLGDKIPFTFLRTESDFKDFLPDDL